MADTQTSSAPQSGKAFSVTSLPGFATIAIIVFVALYLPIITLVIYSFNASASPSEWTGFSLEWYRLALQNDQVKDATIISLIVASLSAVISTTVATMAALGTTRQKDFPGQTLIYVMINQPLMVPEIVTAVALLIVVAAVKLMTGYSGLGYLILAHSAFCIPFA
ncbi:MAG: spermidine/putrescine ABC transporter permease PotC, partial [Paracoccaceae bacterium]